jgi:hypothetical protein
MGSGRGKAHRAQAKHQELISVSEKIGQVEFFAHETRVEDSVGGAMLTQTAVITKLTLASTISSHLSMKTVTTAEEVVSGEARQGQLLEIKYDSGGGKIRGVYSKDELKSAINNSLQGVAVGPGWPLFERRQGGTGYLLGRRGETIVAAANSRLDKKEFVVMSRDEARDVLRCLERMDEFVEKFVRSQTAAVSIPVPKDLLEKVTF